MSFFVPTRFVWRFGGRQVRLGQATHTAAAVPACSCVAQQPSPWHSIYLDSCVTYRNQKQLGRCMAVLLLQVHLCGSFTRWVETIPMAPVDGTPGVFAVVVHLPPG